MEKLKREVKSVAMPYLGQIEELNRNIENKERSLKAIQKEIDAKKKTAADLEVTARAALGAGGNPVEALQKAAALKNEVESMASFLVNSADCAEADKKEIVRLQNEMLETVKGSISRSVTMADKKHEFKEALKYVVEVVDGWNQAVKDIYLELGVQAVRHQLLKFEDDSEERRLAGRISNLTHPHQHLWN